MNDCWEGHDFLQTKKILTRCPRILLTTTQLVVLIHHPKVFYKWRFKAKLLERFLTIGSRRIRFTETSDGYCRVSLTMTCV